MGVIIFILIIIGIACYLAFKDSSNTSTNYPVTEPSQPSSQKTVKQETASSQVEITPEFLEALNLISQGKNVFIHGKPGTGKSTFIRRLKTYCDEKAHLNGKMVISAPTGIAAMNAKGQILHSMLWLDPKDIHKPLTERTLFNLQRRTFAVGVIVIDEVAMIRADMLDAVNARLQQIFENKNPFGGKQAIFVGDLYQLDPVVDEDSELAQDAYFMSKYGSEQAFLFNSPVFEQLGFNHVFFTKIFRQKDQDFISNLDFVRIGKYPEIYSALQYFNRQLVDDRPENILSLCAKKKDAEQINMEQLNLLPGKEYICQAVIRDDNKKYWSKKKEFPAPLALKLKVGAVVLILKNDESSSKRWANGSIGTITKIREYDGIIGEIEVKLDHYYVPVTIQRDAWYKIKMDEKGNQVEDKEVFFKQFPLQLAWACTIHKAQGLTLDKAYIDIGNGAFSAGQTYVALSRIRSVQGLFLKKTLTPRDIIIDNSVKEFFEKINKYSLQAID